MAVSELLENLLEHIRPTIEAFGSLPAATLRLHNFTDADLALNEGPVILLRRLGTGGDDDDIAQQVDVDVTLLVSPTQVKVGENLAHTLRLFLKSEEGFVGPGTFGYVVFSHLIGPVQLQNGRHRYAFVVRCFTETQ